MKEPAQGASHRPGRSAQEAQAILGPALPIAFAVLTTVFLSSLTFWALGRIKASTQRALAENLTTVLDSTRFSVQLWLHEQLLMVRRLGNDERLRVAALDQIARHQRGEALLGTQELGQMRDVYRLRSEGVELAGFFVITADGTSVASLRDSNIGTQNIITQKRNDLFERALSGDTLVIPPIPSDVVFGGQGKIAGESTPPTMFVATPLYDDDNQVLGVLAHRYSPHGMFSRIHHRGRIGNSGETYSFDRKGWLLSSSRFEEQLIDIGLLSPGTQSILSFRVSDPGRNLVKSQGAVFAPQAHAFPLTLMAQSAIGRGRGHDVEGYRDYRGVPVVGAWVWDDNLGFGMTTELDADEAFEPYHRAQSVAYLALGLAIILSTLYTAVLIFLNRRARRSVATAHGELERRVQERTKEAEDARAEAESALQVAIFQESRFRTLVENVPGTVYRCALDSDRTMSFISDNVEELCGYPARDFLNHAVRTFASIIHPDDAAAVETDVMAGVQGDGQFTIDYRVIHRDGSIHWVYERGQVVRDEQGEVTHLDGMIMDMTERKTLELAMAKAKGEAEQASLAKNEFLACMSHEIRTPMNGVLGMLELVLASDLEGDIRRQLNIARQSAHALLAVIGDILDFTKIEANRLELVETEFDLQDLVQSTVESLHLQADDKGLRLLVNTGSAKGITVRGAEGRVRQVLTNLVGNAIKFTNIGEVEVLCRVTAEAGNRVGFSCTVRDTGVGIAAQDQSKIFETFTQVDSSSTRRYGGTGLGLAISKRLCVLMGGDISVSSQLGEGSYFTFTLPFERVPLGRHGVAQTSSPAASKPAGVPKAWRVGQEASALAPKVLVVEDNAVNQIVTCRMLDKLGFRSTVATNGQHAINQLLADKAETFALVLMDCQMPVLDGYQATARIREGAAGEGYAKVPIVALTAHAMPSERQKCLDAGMDDWLTKPLSLESLAKTLAKYFEEHQGDSDAA